MAKTSVPRTGFRDTNGIGGGAVHLHNERYVGGIGLAGPSNSKAECRDSYAGEQVRRLSE